jgi:hypothetical protein
MLLNANVRYGSKADIGLAPVDVRFTPNSGHQLMCSGMSALCQYQTLPDIIRSLVSGKKSAAGDAVLAAAIAAWLWCRN